MRHYADSSFLVSCYIVDANTKLAKAWLSSTGAPLPFTALHALEVRNGFKLGLFRGLFTVGQATAAWSNLEKDLRSGRLVRTLVKWPVTFRIAAGLSERHSASLGTRSLDILHVAAAKAMRSIEFVSFDVRQRALAARVGLRPAP
jgi:predicted nucleic acid-binding protein